jgi:hypothetical protein
MKKIALLLTTLFAFAACDDDEIMCTMDFRMITIDVVDENDEQTELDEYYVTLSNTGDTVLRYTDEHLEYLGGVIIFTDNEMKHTDTKGKIFTFTAYLDSAQVINEDYLIRHDKCHIELVSGKTKITL